MLLRIQPRLNLGARPDAFFHSLLHPTVPREYVRAHDHALELRHADKKRRDAEARRAAEERAIQAKLDAGPDPDDPAYYGGSGLTQLPASHPEDKRQLAASHMGSDDTDAEGDLPASLPNPLLIAPQKNLAGESQVHCPLC